MQDGCDKSLKVDVVWKLMESREFLKYFEHD